LTAPASGQSIVNYIGGFAGNETMYSPVIAHRAIQSLSPFLYLRNEQHHQATAGSAGMGHVFVIQISAGSIHVERIHCGIGVCRRAPIYVSCTDNYRRRFTWYAT